MPYSNLDKYEMALRQAKVDIGQGRGNAMTNAITVALAFLEAGFIKKEEVLDCAFDASDKIFHYNQVKIDADYEAWHEANDKRLRVELGLEEEVIIDGEQLQFTRK